MANSLKSINLEHNLVDISASNIAPTWDNGRSGNSYIAKRLDRFLIQDMLIERFGMVSSKIISSYISYHFPIILH